jgi:signal transduction histidine kinase
MNMHLHTRQATLLAGTPLTEEQIDLVNSLLSCGQSLLMIINDILDFSKIESGMMGKRGNPFLCSYNAVFLL